MDIGDRIQLVGTDWKGKIVGIIPEQVYIVLLDNGIKMHVPETCITLIAIDNSCNTIKERNEKGQFLPGHRAFKRKKGSNNIRQTRKELLEQLQPFINTMGELIEQIDLPEDKILAVSRMMKFCIPTYSSIEFTESAPRSLSAEEKLMQLNAKYNNLPDPTEKDEEDTDEED